MLAHLTYALFGIVLVCATSAPDPLKNQCPEYNSQMLTSDFKDEFLGAATYCNLTDESLRRLEEMVLQGIEQERADVIASLEFHGSRLILSPLSPRVKHFAFLAIDNLDAKGLAPEHLQLAKGLYLIFKTNGQVKEGMDYLQIALPNDHPFRNYLLQVYRQKCDPDRVLGHMSPSQISNETVEKKLLEERLDFSRVRCSGVAPSKGRSGI